MDKWDIIDEIIKIELDMFISVNASEKNDCQERPDTFKIMRWMTHSVLRQETLESLLSDLNEASENGRNLMTEKYGRIDDLIPPLKDDCSVIDSICEREVFWLKQSVNKYPSLIKGQKPAEFIRYMMCEYETYSDRTLELLLQDVIKAERENMNLCEMRYANLFRRIGYKSLDAAAEAFSVGGSLTPSP